jgi:8-oxo-dGTP pyrophosphatase MutT (NUDIX family)
METTILALLQEQGEVLGQLTGMVQNLLDSLDSTARRESWEEAALPSPRGGQFLRQILFARYPGFARDYDWLRAEGYLTETPGGLTWNRSKQSLAEYFGRQEHPDRRHHWRDIERVFQVRRLKSSLSRNGDPFKKMSLDYQELLARRGKDE